MQTSDLRPQTSHLTLKLTTIGLLFGSFFYGCSKEAVKADNVHSTAEIDITPRIRHFIEQANLGAIRKNGNILDPDSAEWYIEAGLNLGLAKAWVECTDQTLDSLELSVAKTSTGVSEADAHSAYQSIHASINSILIPDENHLIAADVAVLDAGSTAVFKVFYFLGSGYNKTNQLITSYGPNEHIRYGNSIYPENNCGCSTNSSPTQCADVRIAQRLFGAMPGLEYPCYYTDLESRGVNWAGNTPYLTFNQPHTNFPTGIPATPYKTYFCQGAITCNNCLSPSKMSFYTQSAWDLMGTLTPASKVKITASVDDWSITCGELCSQYFHGFLFTYGKLNCPRTK